jgi:hypothetical protein
VEPDVVELDPALLEAEPDGPLARGAASLQRLWSRARPALAISRRLLVAFARALVRGVDRSRPVALRWLAAGARWWAAGSRRRRLTALVRRLWPGWPTTVGQLSVMSLMAFLLGSALVLPFALASRRARPAVAPHRVAATLAAPPALPQAEPPALRPPPEAPRPSRAQLARDMARESFESGRPLDGVGYFQIALRAQPRAPGDDVLILHTIEALADRAAAGAAARLLRALGTEARRLLEETALRHPDPAVRAGAWRIIGRGGRSSRPSRRPSAPS